MKWRWVTTAWMCARIDPIHEGMHGYLQLVIALPMQNVTSRPPRCVSWNFDREGMCTELV